MTFDEFDVFNVLNLFQIPLEQVVVYLEQLKKHRSEMELQKREMDQQQQTDNRTGSLSLAACNVQPNILESASPTFNDDK